jgi:hypothetical protein
MSSGLSGVQAGSAPRLEVIVCRDRPPHIESRSQIGVDVTEHSQYGRVPTDKQNQKLRSRCLPVYS